VVLRDPGGYAALTLNAGNNLVLKDGTSVRSQKTGISMSSPVQPESAAETVNGSSRQRGVYLDGNAALQTADGQSRGLCRTRGDRKSRSRVRFGTGNAGNNGIRTTQGGSVLVAARTGDVNTGGNFNGYTFGQNDAPYYKAGNNVGGVSTVAGGDVTILAGGM